MWFHHKTDARYWNERVFISIVEEEGFQNLLRVIDNTIFFFGGGIMMSAKGFLRESLYSYISYSILKQVSDKINC